MTRAEYTAHVRALAMDPQAFCEKFENDAKAKGLEPTEELLHSLLNKLYNLGILGTASVVLLGIYYIKTNK